MHFDAIAILAIIAINAILGYVPLTLGDWGICVALASVVLWADELRKLAARGSRPAAAPAGA
ncbi:MAG: cation-translocating P-type ATPase C-terminal domain-containing protein [Actinomycetota bacterium]|nr:cation-translocating P-type ATPase C-terminal domain-containing protein [Actinomycetota bacterium]